MVDIGLALTHMKKVDVVIVNWNSDEQLRQCIESLQKFGGDQLGKVVVIDNASSDNSIDLIQNFSFLEIIKSEENLGFGRACNIGAKNTHSEYLLFLNPDAALHSDTLSKVLCFMNSEDAERVGICGVQLVDENKRVSRSCARFPTATSFFAHALGIDKVFSLSSHMLSDWDHLDSRSVDHVIGAFFFVRRKLFDSINGFDEDFFLYLEDLDFSLRACKDGWKSYYLANAQAFHRGGGTSRKIKAKRLFYSLSSRLVYAFKHFSTGPALFVFFSTSIIEPFTRSFFALCKFSISNIAETWVAYSMLWRWLLARRR